MKGAQVADIVDPLDMVIKDFPVGNRTYKALLRGGIRTVGDLCEVTAWDLRDIRGFGEECMNQTVNALASMGLSLKSSNYFNRR